MHRYLAEFICANLLLCTLIILGDTCDTCDPNSCEPPENCLAGIVKDSCDCCYVCGRKEGERCDFEDLNIRGFGKCGDHLRCRARDDLDRDDPPEAVCFCESQNPLCGSNGVTYENICQLTEARYIRRNGLRAVSNEPCFKHPEIITAPLNVRNSTGKSAAMSCEASGWPIPAIHWFVQRGVAHIKLPGNNTRVAARSYSGPGFDETTSWLMFSSLAREDEGTYICQAENPAGFKRATAAVSIV